MTTDTTTLAPIRVTTPGTSIPLMAAIVPFAVAIVFLPFGMRPAPATTTTDRPALAFAEYVVDMGPYPIQPRPVVGARFQFTNRSDSEVRIERMDASCGCLSPQVQKKTWAAGETGDLDLRVSTVGQAPGPHEYTLRLEYKATTQTEAKPTVVTLAFKVVFPDQKIVVRPRSLLFYQLGDQPIEQDVVVSDHRGQSLEIESIETQSPYVSARKVQETMLEGGAKRFTIRIKVSGTVPTGDTRALVNLKTNDAEFPVVQVPLMIKGPKGPSRLAISAKPELLILASEDDETELTGTLQLKGTDGNSINIRSVTADPPVIQAAYEQNGNNRITTISATVEQQHVTGFNRGMLTIETDEPNRGRMQVPIMLRPARKKARPIGPSVD